MLFVFPFPHVPIVRSDDYETAIGVCETNRGLGQFTTEVLFVATPALKL
jgi:hypothetical protein